MISTSCSPQGTLEQLNYTTIGGVGPFSGTWQFGDGFTAAASNVTHFYTANGTFELNLTLTDSFGRTVVLSEAIEVAGPACTVYHPPPPPGTTPTSTPAMTPEWEYALAAVVAGVVVAAVLAVILRRRR